MKFEALLSISALSLVALAQQPVWGQCGGQGWSGGTTCVSGSCCTFSNTWYSQCLPCSSNPSTSTARPSSTTTSTTASVPTSTFTTRTTVPGSSTTPTTTPSTPTGTAPGPTLLPNNLWIRGVQAPYFHFYLQTSPPRTAAPAIFGRPANAGQFRLENGQLTYLVDTSGTRLYMHVETRADSSVMKLATSFASQPNTYGTFGWSGDALLWTHPSIQRQNNAAWLICTGDLVHINLGAFGYQTPAGCSDATIHSYNGATADP